MTPLVLVINPAAGGTAEDPVSAAAAVLRGQAELTVVEAGSPADLDALLDRCDARRVPAGRRRRGRLGPPGRRGAAPARPSSRPTARWGWSRWAPATTWRAPSAYRSTRRRRRGRSSPAGRVSLDLVTDDAGGVVVNVVHLGVGAEAAWKAAALKDRLGTAAYAVGSVAAGAGATGWHLRVTVDDEARARRRRGADGGRRQRAHHRRRRRGRSAGAARRRAARHRGRDLDRAAGPARLRGGAARGRRTSSATTSRWSAAGP